jgi:hypothetical protein
VREKNDALTRTLRPLLASIDGGPFTPESGLPAEERAYWLLFELESSLGASDAIARSIASFEAPAPFPRPAPTASNVEILRIGSVVEPSDPTFADLGLSFPLYEAPASSSSCYIGGGICAIDGIERAHCFEVDERVIGYEALARGDAAFVIDTELGMVTPELAREGRTHGAPVLDVRDNAYELRRKQNSDWIEALVPSHHLEALVATPPYTTWQGERWLFHCSEPMIFVGEKTAAELDDIELDDRDAAELTEYDAPPDQEGCMTFRCRRCGVHRFHLDLD